MSMWQKRLMLSAWPAFLMAGVLEMLVFSLIDPQDMSWFGQPVELSRSGVYTLVFFSFWFICMLGNALTLLLMATSEEVDAHQPQVQR